MWNAGSALAGINGVDPGTRAPTPSAMATTGSLSITLSPRANEPAAVPIVPTTLGARTQNEPSLALCRTLGNVAQGSVVFNICLQEYLHSAVVDNFPINGVAIGRTSGPRQGGFYYTWSPRGFSHGFSHG